MGTSLDQLIVGLVLGSVGGYGVATPLQDDRYWAKVAAGVLVMAASAASGVCAGYYVRAWPRRRRDRITRERLEAAAEAVLIAAGFGDALAGLKASVDSRARRATLEVRIDLDVLRWSKAVGRAAAGEVERRLEIGLARNVGLTITAGCSVYEGEIPGDIAQAVFSLRATAGRGRRKVARGARDSIFGALRWVRFEPDRGLGDRLTLEGPDASVVALFSREGGLLDVEIVRHELLQGEAAQKLTRIRDRALARGGQVDPSELTEPFGEYVAGSVSSRDRVSLTGPGRTLVATSFSDGVVATVVHRRYRG